MSRRKFRALRITAWILGGFISLVLLITLLFYLGRGLIMKKAVAYVNENQPGEVRMGTMRLIPFMGFPDVALQLKNVNLYESKSGPGSLYQEPILNLNDVFVSLDIVDLVRGDIRVSRARFHNGFIRLEVYGDSVMNLEKALGIRFSGNGRKDTTAALPALEVDMNRIELENLEAFFNNKVSGDRMHIKLNRLVSSFSYLPELIRAAIELNMEVNHFKYLTYNLDTQRELHLSSAIEIDPVLQTVKVAPSSLVFSGLELETWGGLGYTGDQSVNIFFRARNTGLDVLNFLLKGILDLDEIEQIGDGNIYLNGTVNGPLAGNRLPVVRLNGSADGIGFRIGSIGKEVRDVSFSVYATNGREPEMMDGVVAVDGFRATFPEGTIKGNFTALNLVSPEVNMEIYGDLDLYGLERMIRKSPVRDVTGKMELDGKVAGRIDLESGDFVEDTAEMNVILREVGFVMDRDTVEEINGNLYLRNHIVGTDTLVVSYKGNRVVLGAKAENLTEYLLGADTDIGAYVSVFSERIEPSDFITDTSLLSLLGSEMVNFALRARLAVAGREIDSLLEYGKVPRMRLALESPSLKLSGYPAMTGIGLDAGIGPDTIEITRFRSTMGSSEIGFSGQVRNYASLMEPGSGARKQDQSDSLSIEYSLSSERLRLEDLLTTEDGFMLPDPFIGEYLEDFRLTGDLRMPVAGFFADSAMPDFNIRIVELEGRLRYHSQPLERFRLSARKEGDCIYFDTLSAQIGESNLGLTAMLGGVTGMSLKNLYGHMDVKSGLLDIDALMDYRLPGPVNEGVVPGPRSSQGGDSTGKKPTPLDQYSYPDFALSVDLGEIRYGSYTLSNLEGRIRSSHDKILYLDTLHLSAGSGGSMLFNGRFNASNPAFYTFSADFDVNGMDVNELDFPMQMGDEVYTLKENFKGVVSADGLAEVLFTPDMRLDLPSATAVFNVKVADGAMIDFTPLQAAAKYLDNKDLNNVRFATLQNSFPLTLSDAKITVPLTVVESTIGQLLIEGEQGLDNSFLYLMRVPTWLVKDAAGSMLTDREEEDEDQIQKMRMGTFLRLTVFSNGEEVEVKTGDKRDRYRQ